MPFTSTLEVDVLREGLYNGSGTILRLTADSGLVIHTVAVPQEWDSPTGPTWIYVIENDGLTLIDAGSTISVEALESAFKILGLNLKDIRNVLLTHGHMDHAGGAYSLVKRTKADIWAHALYKLLQNIDINGPLDQNNGLMKSAIDEINSNTEESYNPWKRFRQGPRYERYTRYAELRKLVEVKHHIHGDEVKGPFTFLHTPGHSPDELTIGLDKMLFSGDHVLPEISPHPTLKINYPDHIASILPDRYINPSKLYGLEVYLRSLKRVASYGPGFSVLPAHRLLNKGKLNLITSERAEQIIQHHEQRMNRILSIMENKERSMSYITERLFSNRDLSDGIFHMALTEVVAHLEVMIAAGDIETLPNNRVRWLGTSNFSDYILNLLNAPE